MPTTPETRSPRTVKIRGEQLTRLWQTTSMSQETFAAFIGMKRSGLFRLLRPGVHGMFSDNFYRLAKALKLTPQDLREQIGVGEIVFEQPKPTFASGVAGPARPLVEIPLCHSVSAGVRCQRLMLDQEPVAMPQGCDTFLVRIDGESMLPLYPDQSMAAFRAIEGQQFTFGKDYLIWFSNGECYFSRVFESDDDRDILVLRKVNPDRQRYPDRRVHRRDVERIARCMGVIVDKS